MQYFSRLLCFWC